MDKVASSCEYYSATKENEITPFATTWMGLEMIILNEVSQRKANVIQYHSHVESKKNDTNELINKTETDIETKLMVTRRETWGGIN